MASATAVTVRPPTECPTSADGCAHVLLRALHKIDDRRVRSSCVVAALGDASDAKACVSSRTPRTRQDVGHERLLRQIERAYRVAARFE